jgi:hypothetical protein
MNATAPTDGCRSASQRLDDLGHELERPTTVIEPFPMLSLSKDYDGPPAQPEGHITPNMRVSAPRLKGLSSKVLNQKARVAPFIYDYFGRFQPHTLRQTLRWRFDIPVIEFLLSGSLFAIPE